MNDELPPMRRRLADRHSRRNPHGGSYILRLALKLAEILLVIAAAIFLGTLTVQVSKISREVSAELADLRRLTLSIGGTAVEVRAAAKVAEEASVEQKAYFNGISQRAQTVLENSAIAIATLNDLVIHTDNQFNTALLPSLSQAVMENSARIGQLTADTDKGVQTLAATSLQANAAMVEATKTLAQAGQVLSDPAIPEMLRHTDAASGNVEAATGHLNQSTALIEAKVRQMTKPASWAKNVGMAILEFGARLGSIFAGFVR